MSNSIKNTEGDKIWNNQVILYCSGLIAISLITLQDYISIGIADIPILVSLIAFSIAIPLLASRIILAKWEIDCGYHNLWHYKNLLTTSTLFGASCALIGIAAAFWHVSWIAGVLFLVASIVSFIIYNNAFPDPQHLKRLQAEEAKRAKNLE